MTAMNWLALGIVIGMILGYLGHYGRDRADADRDTRRERAERFLASQPPIDPRTLAEKQDDEVREYAGMYGVTSEEVALLRRVHEVERQRAAQEIG